MSDDLGRKKKELQLLRLRAAKRRREEEANRGYWALEPFDLKHIPKKETVLRGGAETASLGFSDEAEGFGAASATAGVNPAISTIPILALIQAARNKPKDRTWKEHMEDIVESYRSGRDEGRVANDLAAKAHPGLSLLSKAVGGVIPAVATGGGMGAITATGAAQGLGDSSADLTKGEVGGAAWDTLVDGGTAAAVGGAFKSIPKVGKGLTAKSETMAEKATGATGKFAEKNFKPGTGKRLMDDGVVGWFDDPAAIAKKSADKLQDAQGLMDDAILQGEKAGARVSRDRVLNRLTKEADNLKDAKAPVGRRVRSIVDDLESGRPVKSADVSALNRETAKITKDINKLKVGLQEPIIRKEIAAKEAQLVRIQRAQGRLAKEADVIPLSKAENIKRDFYEQSNFIKPNTTKATKTAGRIFKEEVEESLGRAKPEALEKLKAGKKQWGDYAPVEEAASGRASQLNYSPVGNLIDTTAVIGGAAATGNPAVALAAPVARRVVAPRMASTIARGERLMGKALSGVSDAVERIPGETLRGNVKYGLGVATNIAARAPQTGIGLSRDQIENQNINIPKMGRYARLLESKREEGTLAATDYILSHSDPEYARLKEENSLEGVEE